jgi:acetoin utilization protein AcuB
MCMLMPTVDRYMSRQPWTIRRDATLAQARELMREHSIRHLPVLEAGRLVGIVSERDLARFEHDASLGPNATVEEAMTVDVYAVSCHDAVDGVAERMAEHKYGSAVVMDRRGGVEGIFTTADGMLVLADILRHATA